MISFHIPDVVYLKLSRFRDALFNIKIPKITQYIAIYLFLMVFMAFLASMFLNPKARPEIPVNVFPPIGRPLKAFILSAYFYPISKSLGNNSLALVLAINLGQNKRNYLDLQFGGSTDTTKIVVMVHNKTSKVMVQTDYERITPHDNCMMISIFATVQLLPNPKYISMVSTDQITLIPFKTISYERKSVVFCISPVYVSEQWQSFLAAVHIYKQFGGYMHIYFISAVTSLFELMQEYEKSGFVTIQPWDRMLFPFVPGTIADAYSQMEFQNTAAAHTDCLLQYKESTDFVAMFDLNDFLIPKIAPTYIEEFHSLIGNRSDVVYLFYESINYEATVFNNTKFFIEDMINSLTETNRGQHGRAVINTQKLNYTYMYRPVFLKNGISLDVSDNFITHLENIIWTQYNSTEHSLRNDSSYMTSLFSNFSNFTQELYQSSFYQMELDLHKMSQKEKIAEIYPNLPSFFHFYDLVKKCFEDRYYSILRSNEPRFKLKNMCPGPHMCAFYQHPNVSCVHVNAAHTYTAPLFPITYYYATDHFYTADIGCYPQ